jgi:primosomal protein N' (replication factor Y)
MISMKLVRVAVAVTLRRGFDYLVPDELPLPNPGCRVEVPFGSGNKIAVVLEPLEQTQTPANKLKSITQILDEQPLLPPSLHKLLVWAARYYHHGIGDVYLQALPALLRQGKAAQRSPIRYWQLTEQGQSYQAETLKRSAAQQKALALFQQRTPSRIDHEALADLAISSATLKSLTNKELVAEGQRLPDQSHWQANFKLNQEPLSLTTEQALAVSAVNHRQTPFTPFLIEGITGSGKTEIYLQLLEPVLKAGQQALILVPEIGLTPQTIARFKARFHVPIEVLHSGLNDNQRLQAWLKARDGEAAIIIGTRSAVFTPLSKPGMIIIDEEHDASFKQQDTFRYHARDVAMMRGKLEGIPVVLGSATPALESLQNALSGRYQHLPLTLRAGGASLAKHHLLDIRNQPMRHGLSPALIGAMKKTLEQGQQVMLFLNRRGYAPALLCHECGAVVECQRCDAFYTVHQSPKYLACHHCGGQKPIPHQCSQCGSTQLVTTGLGTEQLEQAMAELFPDVSVARIDRDSTRRKGSLDNLLDAILNNEHQILIGTQMLAKGHHFPNVTLVALVDIDHALFCSDFRAPERLAQIFVQVAGRAGRAGLPGKVILQSHHPEHELLQDLVNNGYQHFARFALSERKETELPPFSYQALLRFEAIKPDELRAFALQVEQAAESLAQAGCWVLPACEAPQPRRAGKYRMQLLVQAGERAPLHQLLSQLVPYLENDRLARRIRWSVDVDPVDML